MLNQIQTAVNGITNSSQPLNAAERAWLDWLELDDVKQQADYQTYREYFNGQHNVPLTTRQEEYIGLSGIDFRFNFMQLPIKTMTQRLNVIGFDGELGGEDGVLWEWWQANRMDGKQRGLHRATAVDGDSYVLVEWDAVNGRPVITHERAYDGDEGVKVTYADSSRRTIAFASKRWRETLPGHTQPIRRLNIYTPDAIYKYRSAGEGGWTAFLDEADNNVWPMPWVDSSGQPLGVPIAHNRHDDDGSNWGRSEIDDLISVQQGLNKAVIDLIEGADKTAYQLPTLKGGKVDSSMKIGPRQILWHPSPDASWGFIPAGDIEKLIRLKNDFIATIAQISQVPLSYFQVTGQVASSATQKADDTGLVSKVEDTAVSYGNFWEDVMYMAIKLSNAFGGTSYPLSIIKTQWSSFVRVDKLQDELIRSQIVQGLVNAGATLDGATKAAGYSEEMQGDLVRVDQVDGIEQ